MNSDMSSAKVLPENLSHLQISRSSFQIKGNALKTTLWSNQWKDIPSYKIATDLVNNQAYVNDVAERGVALIYNFNSSISKDEEQK